MHRSAILIVALLLLVPGSATAAYDTGGGSVSGTGSVPDPNRAPTTVLDVCLTGNCTYTTIQAAVDAAPDGALIRVWPGYYQATSAGEALVTVANKTNITIRGMGDGSNDTVLDAHFLTDYVVYGDHADGLVLQNFDAWHGHEHGVFVTYTDGVWLDHVRGFMSSSYELFYFATDHGVMLDCEAAGGGDSGIYIGASPANGRVTNEVSGCWSHHNVLGFSGTNGNYVWLHDNVFDDNAAGVVFDSETDHPSYPQRGATIEANVIRDNNFDVYDGVCGDANGCSNIRPEPLEGIMIPVGLGLFLPSNNLATVEDNHFINNSRAAAWLTSGQGLVAGPVLDDPHALPFVAHGNRFLNNALDGNGVDFMWDGLGYNNCWEGNERADWTPPTTDGAVLPPCTLGFLGNGTPLDPSEDLPASASAPNPVDLAALASLVVVDGPDGSHPLCHYMGGTEPCVGGQYNMSQWPSGTDAHNQPSGEQAPPTPPTCGPQSDPSCWS